MFLTMHKQVLLFLLTALPVVAAPALEVHRAHRQDPPFGFPDDWVELRVVDNGRSLKAEPFYTSYGQAGVVNITDKAGARYGLLRHGRGRGTNVRLEYLTVYRLNDGLEEVLRFPLSGPAGTFSRWEYQFTITLPDRGGIILDLTRVLDGEDPHHYPPTKNRIIRVD